MVYMSWVSGLMQGIKIVESIKKLLVLSTISYLVVSFNSIILICVLSLNIRGVLSVTALGVYVGYAVFTRLMMMLIVYSILRLSINLTYKVLILGILPLPVFFIKVFRFWRLYVVIILSVIVLLER